MYVDTPYVHLRAGVHGIGIYFCNRGGGHTYTRTHIIIYMYKKCRGRAASNKQCIVSTILHMCGEVGGLVVDRLLGGLAGGEVKVPLLDLVINSLCGVQESLHTQTERVH